MTRESSLVSAQWVEENLDNPDLVLVEVDEDTTAYDKGHIKGAIKLDWTTDLQDQVRRDFVNKSQFEALLSEQQARIAHQVGKWRPFRVDAEICAGGGGVRIAAGQDHSIGRDDEAAFFPALGKVEAGEGPADRCPRLRPAPRWRPTPATRRR